jgi:actin related protein 2/3 complex subunit 1A/1B
VTFEMRRGGKLTLLKGLNRLSGESVSPSTRSVESSAVPPEDGFTVSHSRPAEMLSRSQVRPSPASTIHDDANVLHAAHDSTITVVYPSGPDMAPHAMYSIQLLSLPCISLLFATEESIIAAGHDCQPVLFEGALDHEWSETRSLDDPAKRSGTTSARAGAAGGVGRLNKSEAFNMFRAADSRGIGGSAAPALAGTRTTATGTELLTIHQNTITSVRAYEGGEGHAVTKVSTTGVDGRLVIWEVDAGVGAISSGVGRLAV